MNTNLLNYIENLHNQEKMVQSFLIGNTSYKYIKDDLQVLFNKIIFKTNIKIEDNPDIYIYTNEEGNISKEDIKDLLKKITTTSQFNQKKVYIIDECEKLNDFAYNALLKTLEEPQEGIYAFLITKNIDAVKPTISSRCQKIFISSYSDEDSFDQKYIEVGEKLFNSIEKNNIKTIALMPKLYTEIEDRTFLINVLKYIQKKYYNLLKNSVDNNIDNYDIINISRKIIILDNNINNLNSYLNKNLSIDRIIIEMWRCNYENSRN